MRALVAIAVVFGAGAAHAGWYADSIVGSPRDVMMLDAGRFIVLTQAGEAELFTCSGAACTKSAPSDGGALIGAQVDSSGCVYGFQTGGNIRGCGYTGNTGGFGTIRAVTCLPNSSCVLAGVNGLSQYVFNSGPAQSPASWTAGNTAGTAVYVPTGTIPLRGATIGNANWFTMATSVGAMLIVDGGRVATNIFGTGNNPNGLEVFERRDGKVGLVVAQNDILGLERYGADLSLSGDAGFLPNPIVFDGPNTGGLKTFAYNEITGSDFGAGFGMGTQRDGGVILSSPVPNPNAPGMLWRARPGQLPVSKPIVAVRCTDSRFCVAVSSDTNAPNVFWYWNDGSLLGRVDFVAGSPRFIAEGSTAELAIQAVDADGDLLWHTWLNDAGIVTVEGDGGVLGTVRAQASSGACFQVLPIAAVISDGLASHDTLVVLDGGILYQRTNPDPIMVVPTSAVVDAGGTPLVITAMTGMCSGTSFVWSLSADAGTLTGNAGGAVYTPPAHFCSPDGGVTVTVTGQIDGGPNVTMASTTIQIVPWGAPNVPQFTGSPYMQSSSDTQTYPYATPPHVCANAPVMVRLLDAGTTVANVSANLSGVTVAPVDSCVGGTVDPVVAFEVNGASVAGGFSVTLNPDIQPLVNPDFSMNLVVDGGGAVVHGFFTVDAGCLAQRGLFADVTIAGPLPPSVLRGPFPVPGPWSGIVPGSCSGGNSAVVSRLYENGTVVAVETRMFMGQPQDAGVGELDRAELPVTCEGVDSPLTVGSAGCPIEATRVRWTQTAGPALQPNDGGPTVQVRSVTPGLDGLIGETISFEIESNAGGGNLARATRSVRLVPSRFVKLSHRMLPVAASSDDVVTVSATLTNTGTCAVSGVTLSESPTGLRYIAGSARVEGALTEASGSPTIGPFALEAGQTVTVTWLGKPTLLSSPRVRGAAFVAGLQISEDEPESVQPSGCGCDSAPVSSVLLAVLLSLSTRRRALSKLRTSGRSAK